MMNRYIRSIDAVWEDDSLVVLDPTVKEFKKVINENKEYIVLFSNCEEICKYFSGPTWVYWDNGESMTYMDIENQDYTFLKMCENHKCTYIHNNKGHFFQDKHGFVNGINNPDKHSYKGKIIVFYEKGPYRKEIPGGSRTVLNTSKEYDFLVDYLRKFDE